MTTWSRCASGERATGAFIKGSYSVLVGSVGEYPAAGGFKSRQGAHPICGISAYAHLRFEAVSRFSTLDANDIIRYR